MAQLWRYHGDRPAAQPISPYVGLTQLELETIVAADKAKSEALDAAENLARQEAQEAAIKLAADLVAAEAAAKAAATT